MTSIKIPLFFHSTSILFIDDDLDFIKSCKIGLEDQINVHITDSPSIGIEKINSISPYLKPSNFFYHLEEDKESHLTLGLDIPNAHKIILNTSNYQQMFTTVFIDYHMPFMNGLEVCQHIKNPSIKKVLLTGAADEKIAVEAFNNNIIDFYLKKTNTSLLEQLVTLSKKNEKSFFISRTKKLARLFEKSTLYVAPLLENEDFSIFFDNLIDQLEIKEYYLIDQFGSFLLLNDNYSYVLNSFLKAEIQSIIDSEQYKNSDKTSKKMVKDRSHLVCYKYLSPNLPNGDLWPNFLRPVLFSLSIEKEKFYFSIAPLTERQPPLKL